MKQRRDTLGTPRGQKEREQVSPFPLKKCLLIQFGLAEVTLQQALESLAVTGLDIPRSEKYADFFCFKYV